MSFSERLMFLQQLRNEVVTTGALTPSSRFLANAITSEFAKRKRKPSVILEVRPGTGVFTKKITSYLQVNDEFHICEINPSFAKHLKELVQQDPLFEPYKDKIFIHVMPVQEIDKHLKFDYIISSLPMNNFPVQVVKDIQIYYKNALKEQGTLSYFEYIGIRRTRCYLSQGENRMKVRELDTVLRSFIKQHEYYHQYVLLNIMPAHVRHLRFA